MKEHENIISAARMRCGSHSCVKSLQRIGKIVDDQLRKIGELQEANRKLKDELQVAHDYIADCQAQDDNAGKVPR